MRRPRAFVLALAIYTITVVFALALAYGDEGKREAVTRGLLLVPVNAAVLLFFDRRNHRWPKWALLVMLVVGIFSLVSYLNARSLLALGAVVALVVLLRGWPSDSNSAATVRSSA